ncbi:MAG: aminodeoxychorismate/anthranilate synthase component II [Planctomycetota bacterium]
MILVLDNQDSFVHNLARYVRHTGAETHVRRSDQIDASAALALRPDAVVLSPGPYGPAEAGCCLDLIRQAPSSLPILGVCLGHQAIGAAFGGRIARSSPRHGMSSEIVHDGSPFFAGCPNPVSVARYHSLVVSDESFPACLKITATSQDDQTIMAIEHRERPIYGVQFHPESILCPHGQQMIQNFLRLTGIS